MTTTTTAGTDVQAVFTALRTKRWDVAQTTAAERSRKLARLRHAVLAHREALQTALNADLHRPPEETDILELQPLVQELKHAIGRVKRWMRPQKVSTPLLLAGTRSEIRYEPKGVVLILAPWNYPADLVLTPLIGAVAAGNCVVLKPSEKAPNTAEVVAAIVAEVFPPDEVACLQGGAEVAQALLALPFDHIFFTGSTRLGKVVMRAAAENLASVTLELGGKSPTIIDASADLALAAERVAWGKFVNAGQTCIAPDYILIDRAREREFLAALKTTVEKMYGTSTEARRSNDYCRIIDKVGTQRLIDALQASLNAGARLEMGGEFDRDHCYMAPTVLSGVDALSPIMREEIFGPILPVIAYNTLEEALHLIQSRPKPLALYVFSRDRAPLERVLAQTSAGATVWNNVLLQFGNHNLPFGGTGESGMGNYHGWYGFRAFSHERAVLYQSGFTLAHRLFPPYGEKTRKMLAWIDRILGAR